ncbi:ethylene receptor 3-like [Phragmites australis]|uniref:ethylene receptor 3-like n=1 Tax=Phragmites australis TaxID=29695 RepID=UPI002D77C8FB|nr:ethylene receptor 3-like [Phragmites australis]XP_062220767.1 ethylene receptor 3-like [Phragmites australis]XP_062220768.1 ethylene receptor 3-like [Phragmites australis]XP_062220769.1 ethylene receptor 3-like [Phragmites australis]XP_062220770.1 ethylene receptor 3-like [Phragmites australis]XP_062220771.1 ethylene receptor 3-like [Phragmites australis]XP_062220772.1 ethylene receptor 3-like [Phragmites australis]XP_062220773.1 ethylene receptor 3-like [Phragmites australis]XP_06222077
MPPRFRCSSKRHSPIAMRWLLLLVLATAPTAAGDAGYPHCACDSGGGGDGTGFWTLDNIFKWQKVSDLLIAAAYFSIPLELLYFVAGLRHLLPFRWVLVQFGAFIVLCGLTHLLAAFTNEPHPFMAVLLLTAAKFLTALVSFLTAITLLTLIPQLLRVKVRESLLWNKARELDREVVLMKRQEEASWHVRMLTREIRRSLDRHTVLYTTLIELSRVLSLNNCAVWMPSEDKSAMCLTHELRRGSDGEAVVSADDADVLQVKSSDGVKLLPPDSVLGSASGSGKEGTGTVAAIRMPMLKVADFKGGTPEVIQTSYSVLVLVPPSDRNWAPHELEIVEVVAGQVAVALSHASLLEESQAMRDRLAEQNRELLQARRDALMASEARDAFQHVMSQGMRRPIHSILGLASVVQEEGLTPEQKLVVDTMARTATVVSTLINDVMEMSAVNEERFPLETHPFHLHSMIRDAACVTRCLCDFRGFGFAVHIENALPDLVIGDERRIFHVLLHMVGNLIGRIDAGNVTFRVRADDEAPEDSLVQRWDPWRPSYSSGHSSVKFVIGVKRQQSADLSSSLAQFLRKPSAEGFDLRLSFSMCRKLVQMMQGNIWAILDGQGLPESMTLVLRFQLQPSLSSFSLGGSFDLQYSSPSSQIAGLKVLLIDDDDINLVVARKLLEKLGCIVSSPPSGPGFMNSVGPSSTSFQLVVVNLGMASVNPLDVASRIRQYRSVQWPLVMAMTSEKNVWEKCAQSGINGVLKKPLILHEVKEELTRILQNS